MNFYLISDWVAKLVVIHFLPYQYSNTEFDKFIWNLLWRTPKKIYTQSFPYWIIKNSKIFNVTLNLINEKYYVTKSSYHIQFKTIVGDSKHVPTLAENDWSSKSDRVHYVEYANNEFLVSIEIMIYENWWKIYFRYDNWDILENIRIPVAILSLWNITPDLNRNKYIRIEECYTIYKYHGELVLPWKLFTHIKSTYTEN